MESVRIESRQFNPEAILQPWINSFTYLPFCLNNYIVTGKNYLKNSDEKKTLYFLYVMVMLKCFCFLNLSVVGEFFQLLYDWKSLYFAFHLKEMSIEYGSLGWSFFFLFTLQMMRHCLLACLRRALLSFFSLFSLYVLCLPLAAFKVFSLSLVLNNLIVMGFGVVFFMILMFVISLFLGLWIYNF